MKQLSDIVVSYPLAVKLNKRGIVGYSACRWWSNTDLNNGDWRVYLVENVGVERSLAAPTAHELLDLLPEWLHVEEDDESPYFFNICKTDAEPGKHFQVRYGTRDNVKANELGDTLEDALAQMLIWLDDNKLLEKK